MVSAWVTDLSSERVRVTWLMTGSQLRLVGHMKEWLPHGRWQAG